MNYWTNVDKPNFSSCRHHLAHKPRVSLYHNFVDKYSQFLANLSKMSVNLTAPCLRTHFVLITVIIQNGHIRTCLSSRYSKISTNKTRQLERRILHLTYAAWPQDDVGVLTAKLKVQRRKMYENVERSSGNMLCCVSKWLSTIKY